MVQVHTDLQDQVLVQQLTIQTLHCTKVLHIFSTTPQDQDIHLQLEQAMVEVHLQKVLVDQQQEHKYLQYHMNQVIRHWYTSVQFTGAW